MSEYIAKRYQIIKLIGKGGMADVYLAIDTILDREVAIKILKSDLTNDPVALERFSREARASTQLMHPNCVEIYDVGEDNGRHYIVMEYIQGYTLKELLKKRGAIPYKEAVWMMKQITSALMEAHKNGIIHRDIKSQNVLIKSDGTIKVVDFGISQINDAVQVTAKDAVLGSVHYLAPELVKGASATMKSDIYSLGIVFFELLAGDVPFKGDGAVQVALQHVRNELPSLRKINSNIPQSVENIVIRACAKKPSERYENAAFMMRDLNNCLKPEHANDPKITSISNTAQDYTLKNEVVKEEIKTNNNSMKKKKKAAKKKSNALSYVIAGAIVFFICTVVLLTLVLCGVIKFNNNEVTVPSIKNYSLTEASDLLNQNNLFLDLDNVERQMTDDVEAGLIISSTPAAGTSVEKGSRVKVVVSEGKYTVMENYVGKNIDDVKAILSQTNIEAEAKAVDSKETPGTIVSQSGLNPGDKINPNETSKVIFEYSKELTIRIPYDILGKTVDEAVKLFQDKSFKVKTEILKSSDCTAEEIARYGINKVIRISPAPGEFYEQTDDSAIIIYFITEIEEQKQWS